MLDDLKANGTIAQDIKTHVYRATKTLKAVECHEQKTAKALPSDDQLKMDKTPQKDSNIGHFNHRSLEGERSQKIQLEKRVRKEIIAFLQSRLTQGSMRGK